MAIETQTVTITSTETYAEDVDMINATSDVLITSADVDDVAMYEFIMEELNAASFSRTFEDNNRIIVERTYDAVHSDQVKSFYNIAKSAWESAGFTVDITYT